METVIRQQGEYLGYEVSNWDIQQIKEKYFHVLIAYGSRVSTIRSVLRKHYASNQ